MRRCIFLRVKVASFYEFVDVNLLNNKRPPIPGGAWPIESLRNKSMADLQQIWLLLVKERNMLASTKAHYLRHQEELGAMPAPSRLKMVEKSMLNIKTVVKERDAEAVARATAIFEERLRKGVYRYPPGPPPPPGAHDPSSIVKVRLSKRVDPSRLRELFGRYDVFESHKGIVKVEINLPEDVLQRKREAEKQWLQYQTECSDTAEYHKWESLGFSVHDCTAVELAPNMWLGADARVIQHEISPMANFPMTPQDDGNMPKRETDRPPIDNTTPTANNAICPMFVAAQLPVPAPKQAPDTSKDSLVRIRYKRRSTLNNAVIQLGYFPNITLKPTRVQHVSDIERPVHPDEIEGPWEALITYDNQDGLDYAKSLNITAIDGAEILGLEETPKESAPYSEVDPVYQEALRHEMAQEETQRKWPHVPTWKYEYDLFTKKNVDEIVKFNYSNVVDYVDREVLLTGRSVWECPIDIDPTCGGMKSVPAHAKKPKTYMTHGIDDVGATDI
ncbi:unnamed protein product [Phytomonas sp. Hart1]|nr:unnamed protein product [Phytomonas sp. Hart1]|eukprot:CCW66630.1 unnamed protein product [Phytomonas sp. isolate Hart1]